MLTAWGGVGLMMGAASFTNWLAVPAAVLFGSARTSQGPGKVVPFTPMTRLISNAHIRAQVWLSREEAAADPARAMPPEAAETDQSAILQGARSTAVPAERLIPCLNDAPAFPCGGAKTPCRPVPRRRCSTNLRRG